MRLLRCRICSETYLGSDTPSHCPFCGAHAEYFVETSEFPEGLNDVDLTEIERTDLAEAIELERSNTRFYLAMAQSYGNPALSSAYKRLARIEAEHCSVFCKIARMAKPTDLATPSEASGDWCANIEESVARENKASRFYSAAAGRATNERVREIFSAISEVEADHIAVDGIATRLASC